MMAFRPQTTFKQCEGFQNRENIRGRSENKSLSSFTQRMPSPLKYAPSRSSTYIITVLKHIGADEGNKSAELNPSHSIFDIEIYAANDAEPDISTRKVVLKRTITSSKTLNLTQFTKYMRWKAKYYQLDNENAVLSATKMTQINAPLNWLESIIDVELDYHLGAKNCLRPENKKYLDAYMESPWAGYGAGFYIESPPISKSKFYTTFIRSF